MIVTKQRPRIVTARCLMAVTTLPASLLLGKAAENLRLTEPEPLQAAMPSRLPPEYAGSMTEVAHTNEGDGCTD